MFKLKRLVRFLVSVKREMANVKWPTKKDMGIYSVATIMFVVFFGLFFSLADAAIALVRTWIG